MKIPFNKPFIVGKELYNIAQAVSAGKLAGDGDFTRKCSEWLEQNLQGSKALLVHSCTAALEMAAILAGIQPGDEVILPSYTFVSTANAFALRGAKLVFVDIRPDTMNIDETQIEKFVTAQTKIICPVHYAGVACEMDVIMDIAHRHGLLVVEDAAQGVGGTYKGKHLGTIGHFGCYSFHETKNVISGEGGALMINDERFVQRAEIIREKGTNRNAFFRGEVDKYSWVEIGSSYLASELTAAFLHAQLEEAECINDTRHCIWNRYYEDLRSLESQGFIRLPSIPEGCTHTAHMFYILLNDLQTRQDLINHLKSRGIHSVFHYVPLHSAPKGRELSDYRKLPVTDDLSDRLLRLPCYFELDEESQKFVTSSIYEFFA